MAKIDELVQKVESLPDPRARDTAVELVQAIMQLHAEALERMLGIVSASPDAAAILETMGADDLVSSVMVLHGLHPDDTATRIERAMEKLHVYFDSRGAGIVLLDMDATTVRVRFTGTRPGAGASAKQVIEDVIYEAAPEIENLVIEGVEDPPPPGFVPLTSLLAAQPL